MEIKLLPCPLCLKPHFSGVDLLRATLISAATSHLSCPVCNELLLGLDKLTIHLFTHVNEITTEIEMREEKDQDELIRDEIDKSIDNLANNNNNSSDKTSVIDPIDEINIDSSTTTDGSCDIKCDICYFNFTDQTILDMHQKLLHQTPPDINTGLYSYHCHLCSKKFKMRGSLMVHLRVVHYGFVHQNSENNHHHDDATERIIAANNKNHPQQLFDNASSKQWECDVCAKLFTTKYFLKKHKRLHTGEMPYYCEQCHKSFTFQQSYHKHMLYHSSDKPYVCNECGRAFKELSTLQNHARIHSGERPFGCETCGKRFRQRVSYLVHQRIHTGVMPYKCTACEKSFRYKVSQRSHKCPMSPPGAVVRVPPPSAADQSSAAGAMPEQSPSQADDDRNEINVKCILSVDYSTGNINFIPDNNDKVNNCNDNNNCADIKVIYLDGIDTGRGLFKDTKATNASEERTNVVELCNGAYNVTVQPDLFSMDHSPLLPDVESLCLTNSSSSSVVVVDDCKIERQDPTTL